jgi:A/G-specific adenine glycosylase
VEDRLLEWFASHGRDLPWRRTRDPYAILVSEVMLQQTQVERVLVRYLSWLERWPTVEALAAASAADVIREWQGLGYNRRALSLHRAACRIATTGWPDDLTELPGVGTYTSAALRRFAFGEDVLPVDVNVDRVRRRTGFAFSPAAAQAVMDLGATICIARIPRCDSCPLRAVCPSRGTQDPPLRRQGPFEGSFRQRRAAILRAVAESARSLDGLDDEAVRSLERDGLSSWRGASSRFRPEPAQRTGQLTTIGIPRIVTSPARWAARTAAAERRTRGVSPSFQVTRLTAHSGV